MKLNEYWQSVYDSLPPMCSRNDIAKTGIVTAGTVATLNKTHPIANGQKVAKRILYPRADVVSWLMQRG